MIQAELTYELQQANTQMIQLGSLVEQAIHHVSQALSSLNQEQAHRVIRADREIREIDELSDHIEHNAFHVLITQQPFTGHNLRYLTSLSPITIDLERIGDEAEDIAQYICKIGSFPNAASANQQQSQTGNVIKPVEAEVLADMEILAKKSSNCSRQRCKHFPIMMLKLRACSGRRTPLLIGIYPDYVAILCNSSTVMKCMYYSDWIVTRLSG